MASTESSLRKIIHVDADSFYASVEMREDPSLRDKPIAVGGRTGRGVIATSNYAARTFGVRSAMPSSRALQLCPQLVIVKPRFELYREVSTQLRDIFSRYTPLIEPLSLDEAYLDVSRCTAHHGSATLIANEIRDSARNELGITVSAGVAPNKFLAKVASDWNKPDGTFTITPADIATFVEQLPVSKIMGVGKVTAGKLEKLGVITCGDLQQLDVTTLHKRFGKYGQRLADLAQGIDERPVKTERVRKSISVERTFAVDLANVEAGIKALDDVLAELERRFANIERQYRPTKRFIKLKFRDFTQTTLEESMPPRTQHWLEPETFSRLVHTAWQRGGIPCRLLGAGLRLEPREALSKQQLALFP
ncbi:MAG: DNA polymerase IV [Halioglobus sp.]